MKRLTKPSRATAAAATVAFLLAGWTSGVIAMWARMSDAELIARSSLIVEATLVSTHREATVDYGQLEVTRTLKGEFTPPLQLVLPGGLMSSSAISYQSGQQGLWLLREDPSGNGRFLADHPQRFQPAGSYTTLLKLLD